MRTKENLIGKRYNQLTIIEFDRIKESPGGSQRYFWICKCDCGKVKSIHITKVKTGRQKSCGCLRVAKTNRGSFLHVYSTYKRNAKASNRKFELTEDEFKGLTERDCYYCGCSKSNMYGHHNATLKFAYNGIDRLDSNTGYIKGNCVPCCKPCNYAKHKMSVADFLELVKKIYEKHYL